MKRKTLGNFRLFLLLILAVAIGGMPCRAQSSRSRTISISPADFTKGYPAVLFNVATGRLTPLPEYDRDSDLSETLSHKEDYFYIEPRDPEVNAFTDSALAFVGNGDKLFHDFKEPNTLIFSESISKTKIKTGSVFCHHAGTRYYLMQLLLVDKRKELFTFRYKIMAD